MRDTSSGQHFLQGFNFQIIYKPGKENVVVDALSRCPIVQNISIAFHTDLELLKEDYKIDKDFKDIIITSQIKSTITT